MARLHHENGGTRWTLDPGSTRTGGRGRRGRGGGGRVVRRPGDLSFEHLPEPYEGPDGVRRYWHEVTRPSRRSACGWAGRSSMEPGGGRVLDHDARRRRRPRSQAACCSSSATTAAVDPPRVLALRGRPAGAPARVGNELGDPGGVGIVDGMEEDRAYVAENTRERERLRALVERLTDDELSLR